MFNCIIFLFCFSREPVDNLNGCIELVEEFEAADRAKMTTKSRGGGEKQQIKHETKKEEDRKKEDESITMEGNEQKNNSPKIKPVPKVAKPSTTKLLNKNGAKKRKAEKEAEKEETETFYDISDIVDMKIEKGKEMFHCKWKGFEDKDSTWYAIHTYFLLTGVLN